MTGTLDTQAHARRPLPVARLSWRAKRRIRRAAAKLARRDEPAVDVGSGTLTTDERELFFAERDSILSELRLAAQQRLDLIFLELDPLPRTIEHLRKVLERAERDLVDAESVSPRAGVVARRPTEALTSDAVLFARRSREHRRSLGAAEAAVARAGHELRQAESSMDLLHAAERAVRERHDAERLVTHHLAVLKRSIFDESLAKHHRLRDILEPRLDRKVQPIPPHLAAGLYGNAVAPRRSPDVDAP